MTKEHLLEYIKARVYQNNVRAITGKDNQDCLLAIVEDCYNYAPEKTVKDVNYDPSSNIISIFYTDGTTDQYNLNTYDLPIATVNTLGGVKIGSNISVAQDGTISTTIDPYTLPNATTTTLGGVIIGDNVNISDGKISIPLASTTTLGVVKIGDNLSMSEDGTLSATGGGSIIIGTF